MLFLPIPSNHRVWSRFNFQLRLAHFQISMSAKAQPGDNAFIESFFKTVKYEEVHLWDYQTHEDVIKRIPYFA